MGAQLTPLDNVVFFISNGVDIAVLFNSGSIPIRDRPRLLLILLLHIVKMDEYLHGTGILLSIHSSCRFLLIIVAFRSVLRELPIVRDCL